MVIKKFIFCIIVFAQHIILSAQMNINLDSDCTLKNSIFLTHAILEMANEEIVSELLEEVDSYIFIMEVDSLGHSLNIVDIRPYNSKFTEELKVSLQNYLTSSMMKFYICFRVDWTPTQRDYEIIKNDLFKEKHTHLISVHFPGVILWGYLNEIREKGEAYAKDMTKYEYLKCYIEDYLENSK